MLEGQKIVRSLDRHIFRGEFLHHFSLIEHYLAPAILRAVELKLTKKVPHLFGQKFELIRKTVNDPRLWRQSEHVGRVLDELMTMVEIRGLVAHGLITETIDGGRMLLIIQLPNNASWIARIALWEDEAQTLLQDLRKLTERLRKQALKDPKACAIPAGHSCPALATAPARDISAPSRS